MSVPREPDASLDQFFASHYDELRRLAHRRLRQSEKITLLDTTSLVHESYLRFLKSGRVQASDHTEFVCLAARVMRSIIVDFVRARRAGRRGGGERVTLEDQVAGPASPEEEIIRVNDALDELAKVDGRLVKVVEMRYFGGLEEREIAASLGVTDRTVRRDWEKARLLLSLVV
ncbi:MAG TPA: ECF-type sigma factor [Bryobacteraceae bacterium]|nr:ECF-type sigma factor [Bryobacteraceae bacterium]